MSQYARYPATGGGGSGVTSLNSLTGALTLAAGSNITITPSGGDTLTIAAAGASLPALTSAHIFVGNGSNVATNVAVSGDLTLANTGAFTVATVGGATAANIASGTALSLAATNLDTASTIVKRDASGAFNITTIYGPIGDPTGAVLSMSSAAFTYGFSGFDIANGIITDASALQSIDWFNRRAYDSSENTSINWTSRKLQDSVENITVDWENHALVDSTGTASCDWDVQVLVDTQNSGLASVNWGNRTLYDTLGQPSLFWELYSTVDSSGNYSLDWSARNLKVGGTVAGNWDLSGITIPTAGCGLSVKSGSNCTAGTAVLSGGTVVVSNTKVTANTNIQLTSQIDGGTPGFLRVSARTNGTSFTITSSSVVDTSTVGWNFIENI